MQTKGTIESFSKYGLTLGEKTYDGKGIWYNGGPTNVDTQGRNKGEFVSIDYDLVEGKPNSRKLNGITLDIGQPQTPKKAQKTTPNSNIVNIKGKDFMTYKGVLDEAHKNGLQSIEILQSWVSEDMTKAWCIVRAKFVKEGEIMFFDGFGSSTPDNTGTMTKTHPVEMSHTRSKARALKDYLNIGDAIAEEIKENPTFDKSEIVIPQENI